jgi:hypothetical protein
MPIRRPAGTTPDLFSALPTKKAAGPLSVPKGKAGPNSPTSQQRHFFLPTDLAGALKRLDDVEMDELLAAVTVEAERRGRLPPSPEKPNPPADAKLQRRKAVASAGLTTGKLNAVRAAFKAGVKPSAIARQFGIRNPMLGRRWRRDPAEARGPLERLGTGPQRALLKALGTQRQRPSIGQQWAYHHDPQLAIENGFNLPASAR